MQLFPRIFVGIYGFTPGMSGVLFTIRKFNYSSPQPCLLGTTTC